MGKLMKGTRDSVGPGGWGKHLVTLTMEKESLTDSVGFSFLTLTVYFFFSH